LSSVIPSTSTGKFFLYRVCNLVVSTTGIIKLKPGLNILLYFQKNSTVITVLGLTILIDKEANIISKIIAGTNQATHKPQINPKGTTIKASGTINQIIFLKVNIKILLNYILFIINMQIIFQNIKNYYNG